MASLNLDTLAAFTVLFVEKPVVKLHCKLAQYVITAKDLFKTRIYTLQVICYRILKTLGHLIIHSIDWPIELVPTNHQMPPVTSHKNILKPNMNPHQHKYT